PSGTPPADRAPIRAMQAAASTRGARALGAKQPSAAFPPQRNLQPNQQLADGVAAWHGHCITPVAKRFALARPRCTGKPGRREQSNRSPRQAPREAVHGAGPGSCNHGALSMLIAGPIERFTRVNNEREVRS
ncbi:hypothetical protein, partial [Burkholderia glumae]|uniref:hypothetical protein n=1 Tax=Burkholderia glumae TaxID=337 RepID=UPI001E5E0C7D